MVVIHSSQTFMKGCNPMEVREEIEGRVFEKKEKKITTPQQKNQTQNAASPVPPLSPPQLLENSDK